jgi:hypothetical protein
MKKLSLLLIIIIFGGHIQSKACTCDPWAGSFKETLMRSALGWFGNPDSTAYVAKVLLLEYSPDSLKGRLVVLQQFRGPLTLDTITYRHGNGANCYDNIFGFASLGDTVIALLVRSLVDHPNLTPPLLMLEGEFYNHYCNRNFMRIENGSATNWDGHNGTSVPLPDLQDSVDNIFANPVSVHEIAETSPVKMFPNPAGDVLQVYTPNLVAKEVTILDISGRLLISTPAHTDRATVDIRSLRPGLYIVSVKDKDGRLYRKKITKQ